MAIAADKRLSDEEAARLKAQKKASSLTSTEGTLLNDADDISVGTSSSSMGY